MRINARVLCEEVIPQINTALILAAFYFFRTPLPFNANEFFNNLPFDGFIMSGFSLGDILNGVEFF